MNAQILVAFTLYFGCLFLIGIYFYKKNKSADSFMLGNRSVNYWVTAIAAQASDMSAWIFLGFPAAIYSKGLVSAWIGIGLALGMWASWRFIAHKIRIATEHYHSLTLSSYLEKRFNDHSGIIRIMSGIIIIAFFIPYIASGLTGMGRIFEAYFGLNYHVGTVLGLGVAMAYIVVGGFLAVAWNNFFQGIFLLAMIILVPVIALWHLQGTPHAWQTLVEHPSLFAFWPTSAASYIVILNGLFWGIGYLGMPHIIVNFMGLDDPSKMRKAEYVGMSWQILTLLAAVAIGLVGIPVFATPLSNPELVFIEMVKLLLNPLLAGFALSAIIAATMSTVNTQILIAASLLSEDFYKKTLKPQATPKQQLLVSQLATIAISLIGLAIATRNNSTVMGLVEYAWSGLSSAFSPVVVAALYWPRATRNSIIASMATGATVSAFSPIFAPTLLPMIPGVLLATLVLIGITHYEKKS
jgi:sodium/proline symporter